MSPWIRFSDDLVDSPQILGLGDLEPIAGWTYLRLVSYAAKHLTDGVVPAGMLRREDQDGVTALVHVELLERRDDGSGYLPEFLEVRDRTGRVVGGHHPSRQTVDERRRARSESGREGGIRSGQARSGQANGQAPTQADAEASVKQVAATDVEQPGNPVPVSRIPSPETRPAPDPGARDDADEVFEALSHRGVRVDRSNGHARMLRDLVATHGLEAVLASLATIDGPIASAGDAAKYIGDALRPRPPSPARRSSEPSSSEPTRIRNTVDEDPELRAMRDEIVAADARRDTLKADILGCSDYRGHQLEHVRDGDGWRCARCNPASMALHLVPALPL